MYKFADVFTTNNISIINYLAKELKSPLYF